MSPSRVSWIAFISFLLSSVVSSRAADVAVNTSLGEWHNIGPWNHGGKVWDLSVDPTDSNVVFAAYGPGGLWRTPDGGASWSIVNDRSRGSSFASVRISASDPKTILAGLTVPCCPLQYTNQYGTNGVLKSTDGGQTWVPIGPQVTAGEAVTQVEFSIDAPTTYYAVSEAALYRTTDGGTTWTKLLAFNGTLYDTESMPMLSLDPADSKTMLVAQRNVGLMRSSDAGGSWQRVDQSMDQTRPVGVLAWSKSNPSVVYYEREGSTSEQLLVYRSSDGGVSWEPRLAITNGLGPVRYAMAMAVDPTNENRVLIYNYNSPMLETLDGFQSYQSFYPGHGDCLNITFAPSNPQIVYNGNDGGVWKSAQGGEDGTWHRSDIGVETTQAYGFAVDPQTSKIYLSAGDYAGILYEPNGGWSDMTGGLEWSKFYINPHDPSDIYDAAGDGIHRYGTWENLGPDPGALRPYMNPMAFDPVDPDTIYSATDVLWVSKNRGKTWTVIGPPANQLSPNPPDYVTFIAVAPSDPKTIFVHFELDGHLWKTTDGGLTWQGITGPAYGIQFTTSLMIMPTSPLELFIGTRTGMYHSTDGGLTATPIGGGSLPPVFVTKIILDPTNAKRLFIGTYATSAYVSEDSGETWAQLGSSLPPVGVWDLELTNQKLYASTEQSLWELDLNTAPSPPAISPKGVISAGAFGGFETVAPGSWIEIYGNNLSTSTRQWSSADFIGTNAPTFLDGVAVYMDGQPAFIDYISPTQVNAQVPSTVPFGAIQLTVASPDGTTVPYTVTVTGTQPGLLAPPSFNIGGKQYAAAQFADGTYVLPSGAIPGIPSRPAHPGETIIFWGVGFGPVTTSSGQPIAAGQIVTNENSLTTALRIFMAQTPAATTYAGLAPNYVGLYQFTVVIPAIPTSDSVPLTFTLGGVNGAQVLFTAVSN